MQIARVARISAAITRDISDVELGRRDINPESRRIPLSTAFLMISYISKTRRMIPARDTGGVDIVRGRIYDTANAAHAALADRIGGRGLFDRVYNYTSPVLYGALPAS